MSEELDNNQEELDNTEDTENLDSNPEDTDVLPDSDNYEDIEDKEEDSKDDILSDMSDEEFDEYLESGKIPDRLSTKNTNTKEDKVETKPKITDESNKDLKEDKVTVDTKKDDSKITKNTSSKSNENIVNNTNTIDYKAFYDDLMKPFKANGKEVTPRNKEDVIALMQMGANYTKKMQALAPMKRVFESLNKANIKEEDINFLIDINNGDKEAIKQLLTKHKVDPMDLDLESTNYVPKDNMVTDKELEFSDALLDISESVPIIRDIMENKWDKESRSELLRNPNLMRALHEEIQLGRFDEIQKMLETERMYGRYKGVSDIQAYSDIVTKWVADKEAKNKQEALSKEADLKKQEENKVNKSKAAPTKSKPKTSKGSLSNSDLLSLSDDEFDKLNLKDIV